VHKKRVTVNMHDVASTRRNLCPEPSAESYSSGDLATRAHFVEITSVVVLQKTKSVAKRDSTLPWRKRLLRVAWVHTTDALDLLKQSAQLCNVGRHGHLCSVDDGKKSKKAEFFETSGTLDKTAASNSVCSSHSLLRVKNTWWEHDRFCPECSAFSLLFYKEICPE